MTIYIYTSSSKANVNFSSKRPTRPSKVEMASKLSGIFAIRYVKQAAINDFFAVQVNYFSS